MFDPPSVTYCTRFLVSYIDIRTLLERYFNMSYGKSRQVTYNIKGSKTLEITICLKNRTKTMCWQHEITSGLNQQARSDNLQIINVKMM